jgi:hypothetical protein
MVDHITGGQRKAFLDATHANADKGLKVHFRDLKANADGRIVLHLRREPKDVVVSAWLHATKRKGNFKGTLSEYIRDPRFGIEKILRFQQLWEEVSEMDIEYETLVEHTFDSMKEICDLIFPVVDDELIKESIEACSLERLQERERLGDPRLGIGKPKRPEQIETYYFRRGKIGGYVDYMSEEDIEFCRRRGA